MKSNQITAGIGRAALVFFAAALLTLIGPDAAQARKMSFTLLTASGVEGCGKACRIVIRAQGEIDNGAAARFEALVRNHLGKKPKGLTVLLRSGGGLVVAATRLGDMLRKYRATVVVASVFGLNRRNFYVRLARAQCVSACVYALMGGQRRVAPPGSKVVLHKSVSQTNWWKLPQYKDDVLFQYTIGYARRMGVNSNVITFAEKLPPSQLYVATSEELSQWRLAQPAF